MSRLSGRAGTGRLSPGDVLLAAGAELLLGRRSVGAGGKFGWWRLCNSVRVIMAC